MVSSPQVQKVLRILVEEHGLTDEHLELLWALTEKAGPACFVACSGGLKRHPDPDVETSRRGCALAMAAFLCASLATC